MPTDIKSMLKKKKLTGRQAGSMIMADYIKTYKNTFFGGNEEVFSEDDKQAIMLSLKKQEDLDAYIEIRKAHECVAGIPLRFELAQKAAAAAFWELSSMLAEAVAYKAAAESFALAFAAPEGGSCELATRQAQPCSFAAAASELLQQNSEQIKRCRKALAISYKEMSSFKAFLEITGEMCDVEGLEEILPQVDFSMAEEINAKLAAARRAFEETGKEWHGESWLEPILPQSLQPSEEAVQKARQSLSFEVFLAQKGLVFLFNSLVYA